MVDLELVSIIQIRVEQGKNRESVGLTVTVVEGEGTSSFENCMPRPDWASFFAIDGPGNDWCSTATTSRTHLRTVSD